MEIAAAVQRVRRHVAVVREGRQGLLYRLPTATGPDHVSEVKKTRNGIELKLNNLMPVETKISVNSWHHNARYENLDNYVNMTLLLLAVS